MTTYIDSAELLWTYLTGVPEITSAVGSNVYGPPGLKTNFVLTPAIMFVGSGGPGDPHLPKLQETWQFRCYGLTTPGARAVYLALYGALHRKSHERFAVTGGMAVLQYAQLMGGPVDDVEPQTGWPLCVSTFAVQFIDRIVP
jgi:hypothetical protein